MTERNVGYKFEEIIKGCNKRIIIATFASNVHRVQQIINTAASHGRKVAVSGRSMENIVEVAILLGYMKVPEGVLINIDSIGKYNPDQLVIVTTGSQGEPMSALFRMAFSDHKKVELTKDDLVILSASPIPGNEKTVSRVVNELFKTGAEVIYDSSAEMHVSGHACQEELKIILGLTKPKYFIPAHGEYRHLKLHAMLAELMGVPAKNTFILTDGNVLEINEKTAHISGTVPAGQILVDGLGVGDVGNIVLRDRKHLSQDGLIVIVLTISKEGNLVAGPDIISRGFVYVREAEDMIEHAKEVALDSFTKCREKGVSDWATLKSSLKNNVSAYLYEKTKRSPMILPVIMEI